jgi:hypothetical protein
VLPDGRAAVLDPTFYGERLSAGPPLFQLLAAHGTKANEIFGAFGLAFEDYTNAILRRMYPTTAGLVQRLGYNLTGHDDTGRAFEIDAALNNLTEAVILETAWLRDNIVLDEADVWVEHIRSRYSVAPFDPNSAPRGSRSSRASFERSPVATGPVRKGAFDQVRVICPVLVVHDTRLDAPAYGD